MLQIYTSHSDYKGPNRVDVAAATCHEMFDPVPEHYFRHKYGQISSKEYEQLYYETTLWITLNRHRELWRQMIEEWEYVVLVCTCVPGYYCRRITIAEIMAYIDGRYHGEIDPITYGKIKKNKRSKPKSLIEAEREIERNKLNEGL